MIDCHIHVVGNGSSGSGARLAVRFPRHRLLARLLIREFGLPPEALEGPLDELYRDKLLEYVDGSGLTRAVILAHEHTHDEAGQPIHAFGSMYIPNDYVLNLARNHPRLLAGVSIHPARPDAISELDRCADLGAAVMKCLPNCQNIDCSDPRFIPFWERMAKHRIPLLAHTGGELSLPVYNPKLANPARIELPLQCGVTVIAAHGGSRALLWDRCYLGEMKRLLARYPNLYLDNSGMQTPFRSRSLPALAGEPFSGRVVHGSDLPIPISGLWSVLWGNLSWSDYRKSRDIKNPLSRDIFLKRCLGFAKESFTRLTSLLPGN
jgi:predicted TIM-barrel fold metal-dependent hydrolase